MVAWCMGRQGNLGDHTKETNLGIKRRNPPQMAALAAKFGGKFPYHLPLDCVMAGDRTRISKNANAVSSESAMRLWNDMMQISILLSVESGSVLCIRVVSFLLGLLDKKTWRDALYILRLG